MRRLLNKIEVKSPKVFCAGKKLYYLLRRLNPFISSRFVALHGNKYFDLKKLRSVELKIKTIIVGAEKSGTTSLHAYLAQHPQIHVSAPNKEPHYYFPIEFTRKYFAKFCMPLSSKKDLMKNHILHGYKGEKIILEATAEHTAAERQKQFGLIKEIEKENPQTKFIYIMREPLERSISSFKHRVRENWTVADNIDEDIAKDRKYVQTNSYYSQIKPYIDKFGRESVLLLCFEDLVAKPQEVLDKVTDFLGVDKHKFTFDAVHNAAPEGGRTIKMKQSTIKKMKAELKEDKRLLAEELGFEAPWL